jgi:hypothetical protein
MASRPFRLTPPEPFELEIHKACGQALDKLLLPPALWCCYPAGAAQLSPQQFARFAEVGLKRGFPDLFIFYHGTWGLEVKRRGGTLSKTRIGRTRRGAPRILVGQEEMFPLLIASGGFAAIGIIHSVDEMLEQLRVWGLPLRAHLVPRHHAPLGEARVSAVPG